MHFFFFLSYINFGERFILSAAPLMVADELGRPPFRAELGLSGEAAGLKAQALTEGAPHSIRKVAVKCGDEVFRGTGVFFQYLSPSLAPKGVRD